MELLRKLYLPLAAAGYSLVYLLGGGGLIGAIVIFIAARHSGKSIRAWHCRLSGSGPPKRRLSPTLSQEQK